MVWYIYFYLCIIINMYYSTEYNTYKNQEIILLHGPRLQKLTNQQRPMQQLMMIIRVVTIAKT